MTMFKKTGFTLIELLIVVAIIAILAAIAVPNFLEAQTRSKVAKARSDMRTLALGIEAYTTDNNNYPFDLDGYGLPQYITDVVTTPIPYVTNASMLMDPFREAGLKHEDSYGWDTARRTRRYRFCNHDSLREEWPPSPYPNNYSYRWWPIKGADYDDEDLDRFRRYYGKWRITSSGPDTTENWGWDGMRVYDPSNGTVSMGDLARSQAEGEVTTEGTWR